MIIFVHEFIRYKSDSLETSTQVGNGRCDISEFDVETGVFMDDAMGSWLPNYDVDINFDEAVYIEDQFGNKNWLYHHNSKWEVQEKR